MLRSVLRGATWLALALVCLVCHTPVCLCGRLEELIGNKVSKKIVEIYTTEAKTMAEIVVMFEMLNLSKTLIHRVISSHDRKLDKKQYNKGKRGRKYKISPDHEKLLLKLVDDNVSLYLDEIQHELKLQTGQKYDRMTISRCLHRNGKILLALHYQAKERDEKYRAQWRNMILQYNPRHMVCSATLAWEPHTRPYLLRLHLEWDCGDGACPVPFCICVCQR